MRMDQVGQGEVTNTCHRWRHTLSLAFWHLPPNSAIIGWVTEGALFNSASLSAHAVSAIQKVWVLTRLCKQYITQTCTRGEKIHFNWNGLGFICVGVSNEGGNTVSVVCYRLTAIWASVKNCQSTVFRDPWHNQLWQRLKERCYKLTLWTPHLEQSPQDIRLLCCSLFLQKQTQDSSLLRIF